MHMGSSCTVRSFSVFKNKYISFKNARVFFSIYIVKLIFPYTELSFPPHYPFFFFNFGPSFTPPVFMSLLHSFNNCFLFATVSRYCKEHSIGLGPLLQKGGKIGQAGESGKYGAGKLLIRDLSSLYCIFRATLDFP